MSGGGGGFCAPGHGECEFAGGSFMRDYAAFARSSAMSVQIALQRRPESMYGTRRCVWSSVR